MPKKLGVGYVRPGRVTEAALERGKYGPWPLLVHATPIAASFEAEDTFGLFGAIVDSAVWKYVQACVWKGRARSGGQGGESRRSSKVDGSDGCSLTISWLQRLVRGAFSQEGWRRNGALGLRSGVDNKRE
jgi:hypothetical protein